MSNNMMGAWGQFCRTGEPGAIGGGGGGDGGDSTPWDVFPAKMGLEAVGTVGRAHTEKIVLFGEVKKWLLEVIPSLVDDCPFVQYALQ
jgi:hypothetical protein